MIQPFLIGMVYSTQYNCISFFFLCNYLCSYTKKCSLECYQNSQSTPLCAMTNILTLSNGIFRPLTPPHSDPLLPFLATSPLVSSLYLTPNNNNSNNNRTRVPLSSLSPSLFFPSRYPTPCPLLFPLPLSTVFASRYPPFPCVAHVLVFFYRTWQTITSLVGYSIWSNLLLNNDFPRILQEIDEVLGSRHYVTYMELGALQYLGQTLKEGLRLHPPIGGFTRITVEQENIGGYVFPARTPVNLSSFVVHRIPNAWQAPDEFDPDRFSPASISGISRAAFFPFSLGPRSCIGQTLAQFEARVLMARLPQEFELKLLPGQDPLQHVTLRPKGGVWCVINRRNYCTHSKGFCRWTLILIVNL